MNATALRWKKVCDLSDLANELGVCAKVGEEQVALFCLDGRVYAINNYDPFSEANVLSRGIIGDLKGRDVVASPIYKHHYDLSTGECLEDSSVVLTTYVVRTQGDSVEIAC